VSLRLVTGPPNSGKTGRVYDLLRSAVANGGRAVLLLPSAPDVARARDEFAATTGVGVRIEQVDRFLESEWAHRGDGRRIVGTFQRGLLLEAALAETPLASGSGPGTASLLGALAARSGGSRAGTPPRRAGATGDLLAALDGYVRRLDSYGLIEPTEALRLLQHEVPDADVVAVHRFSDLDPGHRMLLEAWGSREKGIVVSLPWAAGLPATESLTRTVLGMERGGAVIEAMCPPSAREKPEASEEELRSIVTGLFAGPLSVVAEGAVRVGVAQGNEAENRLIVRYVRDWIAAGVPLGRIAVAFRDPSRHVPLLRRAFDISGIPAEYDVPLSLVDTALGAALQRLWACAVEGAPQDLVAFARTPFSGVAQTDCDAADGSIRRGGGFDAAIARMPGLARLVGETRRLADLPIMHDTAIDWQNLVGQLFRNAHGANTPTPGRAGASDASVLRALDQGLDQAIDLGEGQVGAGEWWAQLMRSTVAPHSVDPADRVLVTSVERVRARRFDAVAIGGLTASEFPKIGGEDRLQGDAVRQALSALGVDPGPGIDAGAERLLFYLAVTRARRFLGLAMQESDDDGRPLRPSVFWDEFLDLYRTTDGRTLMPVDRECAAEKLDCLSAEVCSPVARGVLEDEGAVRSVAGRPALSAGEIETYVDCPYRWYRDYVVRAAGLDVSLDRMAAGSAAHRALALFYRRWRADHGHRRVTSELAAEARAVASQATEEAIAALTVPSDLEQQQLVASIRSGVLSIVERDAVFLPGYEPAHFEWAFGAAEGDPGVDIGGVTIKGRADRIDVGPAGLVVIDYKRSTAPSLAAIAREGRLQLQLYALAASSRLELPVAGGLYRRLDRPEDRGFVVSGVPGAFKPNDVVDRGGLQEVLDAAVETARTAAQGIAGSFIEPSADARGCAWCGSSAICGIAHP
jgi:RecB family exonuclease